MDAVTETGSDPVREQRARWSRAAKSAKRAGYLCWGVAVVLVIVGLLTSFDAWIATTVTALLVIGSVGLLPGTIVSYAVNAAERHDRAIGR